MELGILGAMVPCDTPTHLLETPPSVQLGGAGGDGAGEGGGGKSKPPFKHVFYSPYLPSPAALQKNNQKPWSPVHLCNTGISDNELRQRLHIANTVT